MSAIWRMRQMPKFMDIHRGMEGLTAEQLNAAHQADLAIESQEGVHFEHAWADPDSGDVFCLSEGPSADAVQRVHERAGHKADEIHPVPLSL
ncbi:guanylate cyclase [Streptomyces sp. NBRC 13847]|nr:guanylate cyclase [Streptomyces sp. NBRC 13847]